MLIPFDIAIYLAIAGIGFGYYIRASREPKSRKVVWPDGTALRQYDHPAAFVGAWNGDAVEAIDGGDGKVYRNLDEYRRARARSAAAPETKEQERARYARIDRAFDDLIHSSPYVKS